MTVRHLDRLHGDAATVGATTTGLTTFDHSSTSSIVQLKTRVVAINPSGTTGNNAALSADVYGTYVRLASGPVLVGAIQVVNLQEDSGLSAAVLTYGVTSNSIKFNVTGVAGITLNWFAVTRPLYWVP